jgi:hypothetical protein
MENKINDIRRQHKSIEYFLLMGLGEADITSAVSYEDLVNMKPGILSYFPSGTQNDDILTNTNLLIMTQIVFPLRSDYISTLEDFDEPSVKVPNFDGYVIRSDYKPKEFYHSFSYIYDTTKENLFPWHYGVFIFWEDYIVGSELYYIAKALIIISKKPYYTLFKYLLEDVYSKFFQSANLEILMMNTYVNLAFDSLSKPKVIRVDGNEYFIDRDTILPCFDLNLGAFFSRFTIRDFLVIAEQFFKRHPIIIFTEDIKLLHPVYFTIMSLLYPLNITNVADYYKFIVPATFASLVNSTFASVVAFYHKLTEKDLVKIAKSKQINTLVIDIDEETVTRYDIGNDGEVKVVNMDELKLGLIFNTITKDSNLLEFLETTIDHLVRPDDNCFYNTDGYKNYNNTCFIRKQLFTYFTKLLTYHLPIINVEIKDNSSIVIHQDQEAFLNNISDENIRRFYSDFITTPSFDGIFQKTNENDPNLKRFIILDELIRIITSEPDWLFFDKIFNFSSVSLSDGILTVTESNNKVEKIAAGLNILGLKVNADHIFDSFILLQDKRLCLDFNKYYMKQHSLVEFLDEDNLKILFYEIESFIYLVETDTIILTDLVEVTHICFMLILCIEIFSINDCVLQEHKFKSLYNYFLGSKDYISKYSFMLSMIYEIIIKHSSFRLQYEKEFLTRLSTFNIQPTYVIFIKSNYRVEKRYYSQNISHKVIGKYIYPEHALVKLGAVFCINGHEFEPTSLLNNIRTSNNTSLQCVECKENDCLFINTTVMFTNHDDRLRHPAVCLIKLLKECIRNNGLRFQELYKLYETLSEEFRVLLAYLVSTDLDKIILDNN